MAALLIKSIQEGGPRKAGSTNASGRLEQDFVASQRMRRFAAKAGGVREPHGSAVRGFCGFGRIAAGRRALINLKAFWRGGRAGRDARRSPLSRLRECPVRNSIAHGWHMALRTTLLQVGASLVTALAATAWGWRAACFSTWRSSGCQPAASSSTRSRLSSSRISSRGGRSAPAPPRARCTGSLRPGSRCRSGSRTARTATSRSPWTRSGRPCTRTSSCPSRSRGWRPSSSRGATTRAT